MASDPVKTDTEAARLLNSISSCNIADTELRLQSLISDYFTDKSEQGTLSDSSEDSDTETSNIFDNVGTSNVRDEASNDGVTDEPSDDEQMGKVEFQTVKTTEAAVVLDSVEDFIVKDKEEELMKIDNFKCGCAAAKKGLCNKNLSKELIYDLRLNMSAMLESEKDLIIIGKVSSTIRRSEETQCAKRSSQTKRKRTRASYHVEGTQVCRQAFEFIHA